MHKQPGFLVTVDQINDILSAVEIQDMIEPIDDPNLNIDFWDWADVIGVVDEFVPLEKLFKEGTI
jgi:hypothetical protein